MGLQDGKTFALFRAACGLLAKKDFEDISVARIAKAGGCSVGAFYGRFPDKKAFLDFVIRETFRQAANRVENTLSQNITNKSSLEKSSQNIAMYVSKKFADEEFAGVIRVAIKLGFSDPKSCTPFNEYRETVTEYTILVLAPHLRSGGKGRIREAIQVAFGILTDAVILKPGPMAPGTRRMNEVLSNIIIKLASLSGKSSPQPNKRGPQNKQKGEKIEKMEIAKRKSAPKPRRRKIAVI